MCGFCDEDFLPCSPQVFQGNRPTNSIIFKKLSPYTLGALIGESLVPFGQHEANLYTRVKVRSRVTILEIVFNAHKNACNKNVILRGHNTVICKQSYRGISSMHTYIVSTKKYILRVYA